MVSALDSGSGGPGSSPGRGTALCSWARYFTLVVPLSTQVYKWVPANLLLGVTLASHPGGNRDKLRPDGPLGSYTDFTFLPFVASRDVFRPITCTRNYFNYCPRNITLRERETNFATSHTKKSVVVSSMICRKRA